MAQGDVNLCAFGQARTLATAATLSASGTAEGGEDAKPWRPT